MRHVLAILLSLCCAVGHAQQTLIVNAPPTAPGSTDQRAPNGLTSHTYLRAHFILPAGDLAALPSGTAPPTFGFNYIRGTAGASAAGSFRVYLENTPDQTNLKSTTWSTAISTMTLVYDGTLALPTGSDPTSVDLPLGASPFVYTGGGLYVAYEYTGASFVTANNQAAYAANNSLPSSIMMNASASSMPATVTTSSAFRPQVRFGRPNPYGNEVSVDAVSAKYGTLHALWDDEITATIANRGRDDRTQVPVQIDVLGANGFSEEVVIPSLVAGSATTVVVMPPGYQNSGLQSLQAAVPPDENTANDTRSVDQAVSCDVLAYADETPPVDDIGFNTGTGILASRYDAPPVPIVVTAVTVGISDNANNAGKTVAGRLLDADGQIVASSPDVVLDASHLGQWLVFPLDTPVVVAAGEIVYAGLLQTAGTPGYFPVATNAPLMVPAGRMYSFGASGGAASEYQNLGTFRIGMHASPELALVRTQDPQGDVVTYTASAGYDAYEFVVDGQTVQQGANPAYSYTPVGDGDLVTVSVTRNSCGTSADATEPVADYTVTASVQGGNGTITPDEQTVTHGDDASGTLAPATDYRLATLAGDTCTPVSDGAGGWSAADITDDCAVTASFEPAAHAVTLLADPVAGGTLTAPGVDPDAVPHGSSIDLVAAPATGWDVADVAAFPPTLACGGAPTDLAATVQPDGNATFSATIDDDCTVTAKFANQAPGFTGGDAVTALAGGAEVVVAGWATGIRSGDAAGVTQGLAFQLNVVTLPSAGLFAAGGAPTIDANGTLRFVPGTDTGMATFEVRLRDDAGVANGGSDTSPARVLIVNITDETLDLSIHADIPATRNYPGDRISFALGVANAGPDAAAAARVRWTPPLELSDVEWICEAQGTATCAAGGSGAIDDTISLPANGRIDYLVEATLPAVVGPDTAWFGSSASVSAGASQLDTDPANDTDTWMFRIEGVFRDGLEAAQGQ